jgi:hypothetical protein
VVHSGASVMVKLANVYALHVTHCITIRKEVIQWPLQLTFVISSRHCLY